MNRRRRRSHAHNIIIIDRVWWCAIRTWKSFRRIRFYVAAAVVFVWSSLCVHKTNTFNNIYYTGFFFLSIMYDCKMCVCGVHNIKINKPTRVEWAEIKQTRDH